MAHVFTREYWENEATGEADGKRRVTRQFKVVYDTIVSSLSVLDAPGLPLRWEGHPLDSRLTAQNANARNLQGDPFSWLVDVEYSSLTDTEERGEDDPRDRPTEIETDFISFQSPMVYDKNFTAVLNTAGDPFDPVWQMEDSRPVIRFSRYETDLDQARSLAFRNAVNLDSFFGYADGELMCMFIKQRRHFENGIECWYTTYEFQGKANGQVKHRGTLTDYKGWDAVIPDMGFNEINLSGEKVQIWTDPIPATGGHPARPGLPVSGPVRLNGFGSALSGNAPFEDTAFQIFRPPYRYQNFSVLGLP